ncbi:MAG: hypothetical protein L0Y57_05950, partial [Beijerinckiaceae bacterium]|nr:hypothetical protein [Beijerinckiaceae bacterium]
MKDKDNIRKFKLDCDKLPAQFPTHLHPPAFWEALGRVVATFGFLEETLGKAIFPLPQRNSIPRRKSRPPARSGYQPCSAQFP